ncbi:hypothetical protein J132_04942 [Termitomyces sp. J132]|nr:hypothetical protein J132_04942 [Termitomyces sp. J132]
MSQEAVAVGGSRVARVKSREVMESDKEDDGDNGSDNNMPLAQKCPASPDSVTSTKHPRTVASKEGEGNVKMRKMTPLATVAEVEWEVSDMEVKGEGKLKAVAMIIEEKDKGAEETKVHQQEVWSNMLLCQVGDNELEWLGKDLAWPMLLTLVASLSDFNKRAVEVE